MFAPGRDESSYRAMDRLKTNDTRGNLIKPSIAIVLAGGLGTRLRAVVSDRPKVLALAAGRPFLDYVLSYLASQGMAQVILSVGYLGDQVKAFAGDGRSWELEIHYSEEQAPLGTGGALRLASQGLAGPFFALNGDTLFTANLEELWVAHRSRPASATLALLKVEQGWQRGCVRLARDGKIISFDEKPEGAGPALANGGVYVLEPQALASIPLGQQGSIEREVFPPLAAQGRLYGQAQTAYFTDIGTPQSLAEFERDVIDKRLPKLLTEKLRSYAS